MATDEEYKSLQAQLQKSRDRNKELTRQAVDNASTQKVTSSIEKAVKQMAAKLGEYDEEFSDVAELLSESPESKPDNTLAELAQAIADAPDDLVDEQSGEVMKLVREGKASEAMALLKGTNDAGTTSVEEQVALALARRGISIDGGESLVPTEKGIELEAWRKMPIAERAKTLPDNIKEAMSRG